MKNLGLRTFSLIASGMFLQLPLMAHAYDACPNNVTAVVAKSAGIKKEKTEENVAVTAVCKTWPHDRKTILSTFAFDEGVEDEKVFVVAMVDSGSQEVISIYKRVVAEDAAVHFGQFSLSIDTAPCQLAREVRAFGIRFNSDAIGASCAEGIWGDELTLYVPDGKDLRPVLQGLAMTRLVAREGCFGGASPDVAYDKARLSLGLAKTSSNGFADLVVTARINQEGDSELEKKRQRVERYILRYDGKEYMGSNDIPWWLTFFRLE